MIYNFINRFVIPIFIFSFSVVSLANVDDFDVNLNKQMINKSNNFQGLSYSPEAGGTLFKQDKENKKTYYMFGPNNKINLILDGVDQMADINNKKYFEINIDKEPATFRVVSNKDGYLLQKYWRKEDKFGYTSKFLEDGSLIEEYKDLKKGFFVTKNKNDNFLFTLRDFDYGEFKAPLLMETTQDLSNILYIGFRNKVTKAEENIRDQSQIEKILANDENIKNFLNLIKFQISEVDKFNKELLANQDLINEYISIRKTLSKIWLSDGSQIYNKLSKENNEKLAKEKEQQKAKESKSLSKSQTDNRAEMDLNGDGSISTDEIFEYMENKKNGKKSGSSTCSMLSEESLNNIIKKVNSHGFNYSYDDVKSCIRIGSRGTVSFYSKEKDINFDLRSGTPYYLIRSQYGGKGICIKPSLRPFEVVQESDCYWFA